MSRYGDPGHEEWLIEQEREDEARGYLAHQEIMAEIGRRETEGLDDPGDYDPDPVATQMLEAEVEAAKAQTQARKAYADTLCFHCGKPLPAGQPVHCGHPYCREAYDWMRHSQYEVAKAQVGETAARALVKLWGAAGVRPPAPGQADLDAHRDAYLAYGEYGAQAYSDLVNGGPPDSDYDEGGPF